MLTKDQQHLRDTTLQSTLDRLLDHTRDLAKLDGGVPHGGMYQTLTYLSQSLGGLKRAIEAYDTTVEYFGELENQDED